MGLSDDIYNTLETTFTDPFAGARLQKKHFDTWKRDWEAGHSKSDMKVREVLQWGSALVSKIDTYKDLHPQLKELSKETSTLRRIFKDLDAGFKMGDKFVAAYKDANRIVIAMEAIENLGPQGKKNSKALALAYGDMIYGFACIVEKNKIVGFYAEPLKRISKVVAGTNEIFGTGRPMWRGYEDLAKKISW